MVSNQSVVSFFEDWCYPSYFQFVWEDSLCQRNVANIFQHTNISLGTFLKTQADIPSYPEILLVLSGSGIGKQWKNCSRVKTISCGVSLRTPNSRIERPIQHLHPLDLHGDIEISTRKSKSTSHKKLKCRCKRIQIMKNSSSYC